MLVKSDLRPHEHIDGQLVITDDNALMVSDGYFIKQGIRRDWSNRPRVPFDLPRSQKQRYVVFWLTSVNKIVVTVHEREFIVPGPNIMGDARLVDRLVWFKQDDSHLSWGDITINSKLDLLGAKAGGNVKDPVEPPPVVVPQNEHKGSAERRIIEAKTLDGFVKLEGMKFLKKGQVFRMFEPDGVTPVTDENYNHLFVATSDAYENAQGVWTVETEPYTPPPVVSVDPGVAQEQEQGDKDKYKIPTRLCDVCHERFRLKGFRKLDGVWTCPSCQEEV